MTSTPAETIQTHYIGIGDFALSFMIRLSYCPGHPGGWRWAAIAEDNMTGWFHGEGLAPTEDDAIDAAEAHLTSIFT